MIAQGLPDLDSQAESYSSWTVGVVQPPLFDIFIWHDSSDNEAIAVMDMRKRSALEL